MRIQDVKLKDGTGCESAEIKVSVSKTDWRATGCTRKHNCACPSPLCPVAAVRNLVQQAAGRPAEDTLVRTIEGTVVPKATMSAETARFARQCGAPDGIYSGHSLRVTGAQRMAMAGVETEKIRVFGRWTSKQLLRYTRDTLVNDLCGNMAKVVEDQHCTNISAKASAHTTREEAETSNNKRCKQWLGTTYCVSG